jgi:malonate-semialdehyde dehydrogenase (acetylating) / methylmalonate-semialdehyde dehydrogenase
VIILRTFSHNIIN